MKPEKKMKEPDGGDGHTEGLGFYLLCSLVTVFTKSNSALTLKFI